MKVVLTAFQGNLSSEPMEFAERHGIQVEMDGVSGVFIASGEYYVLDDGVTAEEYRLVEVKSKE
jgi:hypothetical protein